MTNRVGCRFYPRCPKRMDICSRTFPRMVKTEEGHEVACHLYQ